MASTPHLHLEIFSLSKLFPSFRSEAPPTMRSAAGERYNLVRPEDRCPAATICVMTDVARRQKPAGGLLHGAFASARGAARTERGQVGASLAKALRGAHPCGGQASAGAGGAAPDARSCTPAATVPTRPAGGSLGLVGSSSIRRRAARREHSAGGPQRGCRAEREGRHLSGHMSASAPHTAQPTRCRMSPALLVRGNTG